jgi:hypothetical protein
MKSLVILGVIAGLHGCQKQVVTSDFCNIANRTVYQGGEFSLTNAEIAVLGRRTKVKIAALKKTYVEICLK